MWSKVLRGPPSLRHVSMVYMPPSSGKERFQTASWDTTGKIHSLLCTHCRSHCTEIAIHMAWSALYMYCESHLLYFLLNNSIKMHSENNIVKLTLDITHFCAIDMQYIRWLPTIWTSRNIHDCYSDMFQPLRVAILREYISQRTYRC
jgi:hypothetical protein